MYLLIVDTIASADISNYLPASEGIDRLRAKIHKVKSLIINLYRDNEG